MSQPKKKESKSDRKARLAAEKQEKRYDLMDKLRDQHRRLADKIVKLEMRMDDLQTEIDR
jgi:predicted  nucleic acid-binding Zn-ribbon protein